MDAFYAAVEQRDRPELRGKPVVVGGAPEGRGVVATASYEARRFGIHSAMPCAQALRRCPQAVFVRPRLKHYRQVSAQIRAIFAEVTDLVEPLSLDEAYLDVTSNHLGEPLAGKVAIHVKRRILESTGLTASAGVGPSKFIAKVASDLRKPDGLVIVPPSRVQEFIDPLPVERIWGVGPATAARLRELGLSTALEVRQADKQLLVQRLGRQGAFIWNLANGHDDRQVTPSRAPRSRGAESTFAQDQLDIDRLTDVVRQHSERVAASLERLEIAGRTVTLKLRYSDFTTITRSRTLPVATRDSAEIAAIGSELLCTATEAGQRPVRLLGVSVTGFGIGEAEQLRLPLGSGSARTGVGAQRSS